MHLRHMLTLAEEIAGSRCQVVVNYASSAGAAEEVANSIKELGGDAIVVGADLSNRDDIERCWQCKDSNSALYNIMQEGGALHRVLDKLHVA